MDLRSYVDVPLDERTWAHIGEQIAELGPHLEPDMLHVEYDECRRPKLVVFAQKVGR